MEIKVIKIGEKYDNLLASIKKNEATNNSDLTLEIESRQ